MGYFRNMLFNFQVFVGFPIFFLLLSATLIFFFKVARGGGGDKTVGVGERDGMGEGGK
jgi:hypothetical protein